MKQAPRMARNAHYEDRARVSSLDAEDFREGCRLLAKGEELTLQEIDEIHAYANDALYELQALVEALLSGYEAQQKHLARRGRKIAKLQRRCTELHEIVDRMTGASDGAQCAPLREANGNADGGRATRAKKEAVIEW